jgi:DNA-binding transcriptional ArsR family regulator
MDVDKFKPHSPRAATLLKSMGNERRLLILGYLANGEKTVGELERLIGISQSALSQHLARLRRDRLVQTRRAAQNIFYSLHGDECLTILRTLQDYYVNGRRVA